MLQVHVVSVYKAKSFYISVLRRFEQDRPA